MAHDLSDSDDMEAEDLDDLWPEESAEPEPPLARRERRQHGHWRSVEEYQEWKRLRSELDALDYDKLD
jgi:hypothetical protein